jgi:hypothetical protein
MNIKSFNIAGIIVAFIIGTLVGTGGYWKYQEIEIAKTKASIDLRDQLSVLMDKVITTTAAFNPLNLCNGSTPETNNKAIELHAKLKLYQQDFEEIERKLANLEGREPRIIDLQFSPPCPPKAFGVR